MSTNTKRLHGTAAVVGIGAVILGGAISPVAGQYVEAAPLPARWDSPQAQNVPQDVRIMQTIVSTALSQVEAPELPEELAGDSAAERRDSGIADARRAYAASSGSSLFRRGDVSGFYMEGYGYLFTVSWPVSSMVALNALGTDWVHREGVLSQEVRSGPSVQWAAQYRQRLSDALRDVIASYGSTLRRAGAGESITFIADFGGGDEETVTMTVKADALRGTDVDANRGAIQVSEGQAGGSERMRTQLEIMGQIIDTSLRPGTAEGHLSVGNFGAYFGGSAEAQHVPGYGVIFRKNGRMSTTRAFSRMPAPTRVTAVDSVETEARKTYREHLDTLRRRTVEILATYGPTLTELEDDDWVGIYYDVGSAAALLSGGVDNYLVQARMRDIRQASTRSDPEAWLAQRLVTNEEEE